jgi:putative Mg2+ transporter-C (MgtC) family protein
MAIDLGADLAYSVRLIVAAILGAMIGLERELHDHPAGMRTHLLVSLGSAGFTVLSIAAFPAPGADPARIAAQIVSGIGFLGAGAILKEGATIRGLTTAASLWATAAVGMAAGAGAWVVATTIAVIAIVSLWPLRVVADRVIGRDPHMVRMRLLVTSADALAEVVSVIAASGGSVSHLTTLARRGDRLVADLEVRARDLPTSAVVTAAVANIGGVELDETSSSED